MSPADSCPPLIIATHNSHKAREIASILPPSYVVRTLADYPGTPEAEENGRTFADNARLKAETASAALEGWVLADDSGLCVDVLCGSPGVLSARYAGTHGDDAANNAKLLRELSALRGHEPFTARFICTMSLAEHGKQIATFQGVTEGTITLTPRGLEGFGYDPLFIPQGYNCTFAEMKANQKNALSHRAQALAAFQQFLEKQYL